MTDPAFDPDAYRSVRERAGFWDDDVGRVRWRVTGRDRVKFLQNMTSQDVKALTPGEAALACALTMKAKLVGLMRILARAQDLVIDVEAGCAGALLAHLKRYVVVNQVAFEDATNEMAAIAIEGPASDACIDAARTALGEDASIAPITVSGERGARIYLPHARRDAAHSALASAGARPVPAPVVEALRVENGEPHWGAELDEATFPPEARLDRSAISYTKGCFLGQEPIARLHFMGHLNRRLMGLTFAEDSGTPPPGIRLKSPDGPEVGRITSVAWSPALTRRIGLGYVRKEVQAPGTRLTATSVEGTWTCVVEVRDLPIVAPTAAPPPRLNVPNVPPKAAGGLSPGGATEGGLMLPGRE